MTTSHETGTYSLAVVGVGNTLAGDDGAGNLAVQRLRQRFPCRSDVLLYNLETDPLELWDIIPEASRFIFLDAVAGDTPGRLVTTGKDSARRAYAPSLHHMDLPTVMRHLLSLAGRDEVQWSVWGVTVDIPRYLGEGLSPDVESAVDRIVRVLSNRIENGNFSVDAPDIFGRIDDTK
jgi:hydrogenase maturation protease